ncbi:hypothetical protein PV797_21775 [Clostridiaceae bacterium M8S5]|nr:hypothetical protein PV797_21775 [Clostridiaceae bacterium M8S5]
MSISLPIYPIRTAKKEDRFILFNTKTFETIYLDKFSMKLFNIIRTEDKCTIKRLLSISNDMNITESNLKEFINFLEEQKFIWVEVDE